ncbi:ATP-dependent helicase [Nakamurella antarctica]|uniref:DNA 3'-5' helicase n=1 Tax=Nakamurella antarctica TaxID=1902245 RepID=A0A3G8ZMV9_9ACTN|nr:ATP-dependent DNA helicase [Nakamurella antarctica]AZI58137.1 ATP-dependent helicase [Nakamurella antarctica]
MSTPAAVTHVLTRSRRVPTVMTPTPEQADIIANISPRLRVLAGPGTGKTATLVECVADRVINRGVNPSQILVLTFSKRAAAELTARMVSRLGITTREPMVRTLHSYAYSLVRTQARRMGEQEPRLLGAGESDQMIREMLSGHVDQGGGPWPEFLHRALGMSGFAAELRNLLARSTESGLAPADIISWGRRKERPEWVAAGQFATEYSKVLDLRTGTTRQGQALDQAELMGVALGLLKNDEILAVQQAQIRRIFVDEYQDVDPAQAAVIAALATGADELMVVGDPDQSIYAFRGSDPAAMKNVIVDRTVALTQGRRMSAEITRATRRVAALLPGPAEHRALVVVPTQSVDREPGQPVLAAALGPAGVGPGGMQSAGVESAGVGLIDVRVFSSAAAEASYIADGFRRAHLREGIAWSQMAVLVRSPQASLPALRRAFTVMGVPLAQPADSRSMVADATVSALLMVLEAATTPASLTGPRAVELMTSPLAGLDLLSLRRLRRALKVARPDEGGTTDLLASVLAGAPIPAGLSPDLSLPLTAVVAMLEIARRARNDSDAESALWGIWQRSAREGVLREASLRGGRAGQQADVTLDAVIALFETAAHRAEVLPGAGVSDFVEAVLGREIEEDLFGPHATFTEAVQILSAHSSKGLEFEVVALTGVEEGRWPAQVSNSSLLGTSDLLDFAHGLPATASRSIHNLADERRLFYVAATRAKKILIATAVADPQTQPSRFLFEIAGTQEIPQGRPLSADGRERRGLNVPELLADLRRSASDPAAPLALREVAAGHLAELSSHRVRGADPTLWWGLPPVSTGEEVLAESETVVISPSMVESLNRCALGAVLERHGGRGEAGEAQLEGVVVHALAHGIALQLPWEELMAELDDYLDADRSLAPWQLARLRRLAVSMALAVQQWSTAHHPPWELIGSEVPVLSAVPTCAPGDGLSSEQAERPVVISGRADWISADEEGLPVVVDFKTSSSIVSKAEAEANPQLATYQVAIGSPVHAVDPREPTAPNTETEQARESGGAVLVYLRKGTPTVREQSPLTPEQRVTWIGEIRRAAAHLTAATALATENKYCDFCSVRTSCPVQEQGRQVT